MGSKFADKVKKRDLCGIRVESHPQQANDLFGYAGVVSGNPALSPGAK